MKRRNLLAILGGAAALLSLPLLKQASAEAAPKGSPHFEHSYANALKTAEKDHKPLIVIFSATWCGPCQMMKKEVYPSAAIQPFHDKFVWAYLDVDDAKNKKVAADYHVEGIPHIQFIDSKGKAIDKQVGSSNPDAFAKTLEGVLKKAGS